MIFHVLSVHTHAIYIAYIYISICNIFMKVFFFFFSFWVGNAALCATEYIRSPGGHRRMDRERRDGNIHQRRRYTYQFPALPPRPTRPAAPERQRTASHVIHISFHQEDSLEYLK